MDHPDMWLTGVDLKQISWELTGKTWLNLQAFAHPLPRARTHVHMWRCCTNTKRKRSGCEFLKGDMHVRSESAGGPCASMNYYLYEAMFLLLPNILQRGQCQLTEICRQ